MIKIKGQFENGAQMRQELLALLGLDGTQPAVNPLPVVPQQETTSGPVEDITEPGVEEKPKTKRRTKVELEAEALKANTGTEEPPASEATVENEQPADDGINPETAPVVEETVKETPKYTLDDAKLAAAKLSRTGPEFRNKAKDIAFKYAQLTSPSVDKDAALVPKIAPEHYEAFIAEIEEAGK